MRLIEQIKRHMQMAHSRGFRIVAIEGNVSAIVQLDAEILAQDKNADPTDPPVTFCGAWIVTRDELPDGEMQLFLIDVQRKPFTLTFAIELNRKGRLLQ